MTIIDWLENRKIIVNNTFLIESAFIHSSYANEHRGKHDNERLEFMGDAVLQVWSSVHIYYLKPPLDEGKMTRLRAQLVCEKALAMYVRELGLQEFLKLGSGEEKTGGREKDAILADMFEALLGALYLDGGMSSVNKILDEVMTPYLRNPEKVEVVLDYKTKLQEYVQTDNRKVLHYDLIEETGPANAPTFVMNVLVDGLIMGTGKGNSKKEAEQNAAKDAFQKLVR